MGPRGRRGPQGEPGQQGQPGLGAIIPFASGKEININTRSGGVPGFPAFIGFGNSADSNNNLGPTIDLTNELTDFAFSIPRDGTITSISAMFSTTTPNNFVDTDVQVNAVLYIGDQTTNNFVPILASLVSLTPVFTGTVPKGTIASGFIDGLNIPIKPQDRLLLVFYAQATGQILVNSIKGHVSAGLAIS